MYIKHAVIMAAGRGQRMMPLTQAIAKPMAPYFDTTLIGHGIAQVKKHIPNIHITVGYKAADVGRHVIDMGISTVINTDGHPNAWWIQNTLLSTLNAPVFVLTCDNVTDVDFEALEVDYFSKNEPACMLVPTRPVIGLHGDYIFDKKNYVTKLSRVETSDKLASGIQILNPGRVNNMSECFDFNNVWNDLIGRGQLLVSDVFPNKWTAVDTVSDLERVNEGTK